MDSHTTVTPTLSDEEMALTRIGLREEMTLTKAGQRKVNIIWEYTQATIAIFVVVATMTKALIADANAVTPTIMAVAFGTVVGFYFGRTNHSNIGGVSGGKSPSNHYDGR